jgi:vacuolar-type H+-ATPase subunit D/Vma8
MELMSVASEIRELRKEMNFRFDSMERSLMLAVIALSIEMLAGFGGLAGLIATQL